MTTKQWYAILQWHDACLHQQFAGCAQMLCGKPAPLRADPCWQHAGTPVLGTEKLALYQCAAADLPQTP